MVVSLFSILPIYITFYIYSVAGSDGLFLSTGTRKLEVPDSHPGQAGYLSSWLCTVQCSELFKGMECTVLPIALCTVKNP